MSEFLFLLEIIMKNINFHANNIKTKSKSFVNTMLTKIRIL